MPLPGAVSIPIILGFSLVILFFASVPAVSLFVLLKLPSYLAQRSLSLLRPNRSLIA